MFELTDIFYSVLDVVLGHFEVSREVVTQWRFALISELFLTVLSIIFTDEGFLIF